MNIMAAEPTTVGEFIEQRERKLIGLEEILENPQSDNAIANAIVKCEIRNTKALLQLAKLIANSQSL